MRNSASGEKQQKNKAVPQTAARRRPGLVPCLCLCLFLLTSLFMICFFSKRIFPNIYTEGFLLTGLTQQQAIQLLREAGEVPKKEFVLSTRTGISVSMDPSRIVVSPGPEEIAR